MLYRAAITSELAVQHKPLPFNTLPGFLASEYSLNVKKAGFFEDTLRNAEPGHVLGKIYAQKTNEFVPGREGAGKLVESEEKLAYYYCLETVLQYTEHKCKIVPAWISKSPGPLSFAVAKNSPYRLFLNNAIANVREKGTWLLLRSD